jgi:hypothetical protein
MAAVCLLPTRSQRLQQCPWDHIQASIEGGLESCTRPLAYALPQCTPEEIHRLDRSVPRTFFSALLDRTVTQEELRHELLY